VAGGHEPGPWVVRRPVACPALCGDGERLLRGVLGVVDVAAEPHQCGEDAGPLGAEDLLEHGLPLRQRPDLDRSTEAHRRDPGRDLQGGVQIGGLDEVVPAEDLLGVRERTVGEQQLAGRGADRGGGLGGLQLLPADHSLVGAQCEVLPGDRRSLPVVEALVGARPFMNQ
jgi:hypothetical protein